MKTKYKVILGILLTLAFIALTLYYGATRNVPILEPKGLIAAKERELIITSALLMLIVVIPVFILTWIFAWKYRDENKGSKHAPDWEHNSIAECCWWGVPLIIIIILGVLVWRTSHSLNPFQPITNDKKPIEIQAVALQWKWLFIYPEYDVATVNFVQFPEGTPINFVISADAPMNSFWIPQLAGQIYAMPAMRSKLYVLAHKTGDYEGRSSNFSGTGFSGMRFITRVSTEEDFMRWIESAQSSPQRLDFHRYNEQLVPPSSDDPVSVYTLTEANLFQQILDKYSPSSH
ncbi:MAG: ubiquinol oxidase subunit II [Simkaniaceae bacterium]